MQRLNGSKKKDRTHGSGGFIEHQNRALVQRHARQANQLEVGRTIDCHMTETILNS